LTAAGLGAGMMYFLDPRNGRRRRATVRDRMIRASHQVQEASDVVARDVQNRMHGLASGDLSVLIGGKNALRGNPVRGNWSPTGRTILGLLGGGMFLFGLTRKAPTACVLGTVGLALMAEGMTNAGIEDITSLPATMARKTSEVAGRLAENLDHPMRMPEREEKMTAPVGIR
jgi:hypothetical protein